MLKGLIVLLRPKHWVKNGLILLPLVFSGSLFHADKFLDGFLAVVSFSLAASLVYIINDLCDIKKDRLHPTKKHRPLASGAVSIWSALCLALCVFVISVVIGFLIGLSPFAWLYLGVYLVINIAYSFGLKNLPIVDIAILSAGFVLRVLYGAEAIDVTISSWLYLSVLAGALYLGLGKRRGELRTNGAKSRKVNEYYTLEFLDKNMYVCMSLLLVFYSLWAIDPGRDEALRLTIPLLILVFMSYSLAVEKNSSSGDPVDVLSANKILIACIALYIIATVGIFYFL